MYGTRYKTRELLITIRRSKGLVLVTGMKEFSESIMISKFILYNIPLKWV